MGSNGELIRTLYDAFAAGDVPTVVAAMDPSIEWNEAEHFYLADRNPYRGPDAIVSGVFARIRSDVDDFGAHPGRITDGGDTVVVEGRYKGTVKATGKRIDAQFVHVFDFENGKVARFQQYTDTAQWANAQA